MAENTDLAARLLNYAARIIRVAESLPRTLTGQRIADQVLRSGISVGAHYEEARAAESRADFIHKLQIGLKELRESHYWLRLLASAAVIPLEQLRDDIDEADQLRAILSKAVATAKQNRESH